MNLIILALYSTRHADGGLGGGRRRKVGGEGRAEEKREGWGRGRKEEERGDGGEGRGKGEDMMG